MVYKTVQAALQKLPDFSIITVAFSGGVDSTVLLHVLGKLREVHPAFTLQAVHVNHQLQSHADAWEKHCVEICKAWDIPLIVEKVTVDRALPSLEAEARKARHACFENLLGAGGYLALAHHAEDQAETLLFRLFRGTGVHGLGGMSVLRSASLGFLWRPLLEISKAKILAYAKEHHLSFVEDPSNQNLQFARNYLRQEILPRVQARWPEVSSVMARSAKIFAMEAELLAEIAREDLAKVKTQAGSLKISILKTLSQIRVWQVLRMWLTEFVGTAPSVDQVMRIEREVMNASPDAHPVLVIHDWEVKRVRGELWCRNPLFSSPEKKPADF